MTLAEVEKQVILAAWASQNGNRQRTAIALGIGLRTLSGKLRSYGIPPRGKHTPVTLPEWLQYAGISADPASLRTALCNLLVAASDLQGQAVLTVSMEEISHDRANELKRGCDFLLHKLTAVFKTLQALTPTGPAVPQESPAC